MKTVTVLGSTGSIGVSTVKVLAEHRDKFKVNALVANSNAALLAEQAKMLDARMAVVVDELKYPTLRGSMFGTDTIIASGRKGVSEAIAMDSDITVLAISGAAGLSPAMEVIKRGKVLALANKETLVCAGSLVMKSAKLHGCTILPVDSEHSAIFQTLNNDMKDKGQVDSLLLTASGGPFLGKDSNFMRTVTPEMALKHPNWKMGAKISIDSATMMNKGLEIIEAHHLFNMPLEKIKVVIHPESIIHSGVYYIDGSLLVQMGNPDMRVPISYALGYPDRITSGVEKLDLVSLGKLSFFEPDEKQFPALRLAKDALKQGDGATNVLNAANEVAVQAFLSGKIHFLGIVKVVEHMLAEFGDPLMFGVSEVLAVDKEVREKAKDFIAKLNMGV